MRNKKTQRTQKTVLAGLPLSPRGLLVALATIVVFNSLVALTLLIAMRHEDFSHLDIYLAGHVVGLSILACLAPWMHAHETGRMGSLQLFLLACGALLGCWLARLLVWAGLGLVVLPQIPGSIAAVSGVLLATIGCAGMYYNSKVRMLRMRQQADLAERTSLEAHLQSLQAHIDPQLFAASLRSIDARIADRPDDARELLATLNRYLRGSLRRARAAGTLASELALLQNYVALCNANGKSTLEVCIESTQECDALPFPSMLLQPLVRLAQPSGPDAAWLWLRARIEGAHLELSLADRAGRLTAAFRQAHASIENIRANIEILFGPDSSLNVCGRSTSDERIVMQIPLTPLSQTPLLHAQPDGGMA